MFQQILSTPLSPLSILSLLLHIYLPRHTAPLSLLPNEHKKASLPPPPLFPPPPTPLSPATRSHHLLSAQLARGVTEGPTWWSHLRRPPPYCHPSGVGLLHHEQPSNLLPSQTSKLSNGNQDALINGDGGASMAPPSTRW